MWRGCLVLVLVGLLTQGCGERGCTLMGGYSGVGFDVTATFATAPGLLRVHACIEDACVDRPVGASDPPGFFVPDPAVDSPEVIWVGVTIRDATGAFVLRAKQQVHPRPYMLNGPGCDPELYRAKVATTNAGDLREVAGG